MTYEEWSSGIPASISGDSLWKMEAYRLALFLSELAWRDVTKLAKDRRTCAISDQLYRGVGKISSNIGEGYSRGTGKDRAHFYEYGLGSVRESRDWYYKGRYVLGPKVCLHRMDLCAKLARLLLRMISNERLTNRRVTRTD